MNRTLTALAAATLTVAALTGCVAAAPAATSTPIAAARPKLSNGWQYSDTAPTTKPLPVLPTTDIPASEKLTPAPLDTSHVKDIVRQLVAEPVPIQLRKLVIHGSFRSGQRLVVAAKVNGGAKHAVDYIMTSPDGQRWEKLVYPNGDIAATTIELPKVTAGQWVVGVEDTSALTVGDKGQIAGTALLGLATFDAK